MGTDRYYLKYGSHPETEVTREEWTRARQERGFSDTEGRCTYSFGTSRGGCVSGAIRSGPTQYTCPISTTDAEGKPLAPMGCGASFEDDLDRGRTVNCPKCGLEWDPGQAPFYTQPRFVEVGGPYSGYTKEENWIGGIADIHLDRVKDPWACLQEIIHEAGLLYDDLPSIPPGAEKGPVSQPAIDLESLLAASLP